MRLPRWPQFSTSGLAAEVGYEALAAVNGLTPNISFLGQTVD